MPSFFKSPGKLTNLFRRRGTPDAMLECIARPLRIICFGQCVIRRYYLFSQPLESLPAVQPRRGASISVRRVGENDPALARIPRPMDEIAQRFAAGAECILAEVNGTVVGFLWFKSGPFDDPEAAVRFAPAPAQATVWDFDVFVDPAHRGGLVFYRLWSHAGELLRGRGVAFTVSLVWAHNDESIQSHQRLGAFPIASAYHVRIARWVIHIADRPPRIRLLRPTATAPEFVPEFVVDAQPTARKAFARFPMSTQRIQTSTSAGAG